MQVELRPAGDADAERLFAWRNLPELVALSTSRKFVSREEHMDWFRRKLEDQGCRIFVICCDREPAGQIRFDRIAGAAADWLVGIYLIDGFRNRGVGHRALVEGCRKMADTGAARIFAHIRADNEPSLRAFRSAGFDHCRSSDACPADHREMVWQTA